MPSSVIRSFEYDPAKRELTVLFQSGRAYIYEDVPAEIARALEASPSKGEYFNDHIRENYAFERGPRP
jgi:lysyl-tRNA synthetase class 2